MIKTLFALMLLQDPSQTYRANTLCDSVAPLSLNFGWHGGAKDITITDASGCHWVAVVAGENTWLTVSYPDTASGVGPGIVSLTAAPNKTGADRSAKVFIGGRVGYWVTVTQKRAGRK